ncbi:MAG: helix-turn-helix domain-containing protein [Eubacteriales bacterium]
MYYMDEKDFALRLSRLREKKGVSAREMSLDIGQNANYINSIEIGKANPSLEVFFYICDYLQVTPSQFFDLENKNPTKLDSIISDLKKLDDRQLDNIAMLVKGLIKK